MAGGSCRAIASPFPFGTDGPSWLTFASSSGRRAGEASSPPHRPTRRSRAASLPRFLIAEREEEVLYQLSRGLRVLEGLGDEARVLVSDPIERRELSHELSMAPVELLVRRYWERFRRITCSTPRRARSSISGSTRISRTRRSAVVRWMAEGSRLSMAARRYGLSAAAIGRACSTLFRRTGLIASAACWKGRVRRQAGRRSR